MTVAAELDVDASFVADLAERPHHRGEVHRPLAEHQVLVNALNHVFDMDVHDPWPPVPEQIGDVAFLQAMDVAQVDRQLKERVAKSLVELGEALERIDEHAGLGFERQRHAGPLGVVEHRPKGLGEPVHARLSAIARVRGPTRAKRTRPGAIGQVDGAAEEIDPDRAAGRVGVHERRVVLQARVEQISRTGLDRPAPGHGGQGRSGPRDLTAENGRVFVGVERSGVEGDRDALVAMIGEQVDRVDQAMVGQSVGVKAESHESGAHGGGVSGFQAGSMPSSRSFAA